MERWMEEMEGLSRRRKAGTGEGGIEREKGRKGEGRRIGDRTKLKEMAKLRIVG